MTTDGTELLSFGDDPDGADIEALFSVRQRDRHTARQEIFLPIYGFVRLTEAEMAVLDHPALQRLRLVRQLGMTHLVYPGATHSRFEHAVGTLHMAQIMIEHVQRRHAEAEPAAQAGRWVLDEPFTSAEIAFIRLAALLHDVAQLPFGHSLEDELGILPQHDRATSVRHVLQRRNWGGVDGRPLEVVLDQAYQDLAGVVGVESGRASDVVVALVARDPSPPRTLGQGVRWDACHSLVSDTLCADLLDYLYRDFHHLGMPQHLSLRILQYVEIRRPRGEPKHGQAARLVLNLATAERPRSDAVTELLALLSRRHELFEIALYHRTKLVATAMLERSLGELDLDGHAWSRDPHGGGTLHDELLDSGDDGFLARLLDRARDRAATAAPSAGGGFAAAERLARALGQRRIHTPVYMRTGAQLTASTASRVRDLYGGRAGRANRLDAVRGLESAFGWPTGSVALYCADEPRFKVAMVNVLVDDNVRSLQSHEAIVDSGQSSSDLTGGALVAGERRFGQLWRVVAAVDRTVWNRAEDRVQEVFESALVAVLGAGDAAQSSRSLVRTGEDLAEAIARWCPTSPLYGRDVRADKVGARRTAGADGRAAPRAFASGVPWPTEYLA